MRIFYALTLSLFFSFSLFAQELIIEPAGGNPVYRSQIRQADAALDAQFEKIAGFAPDAPRPEGPYNNCPPDFVGLLVEAGQSMAFDLAIDTLVLGGGGNPGDVITLKNAGQLAYGTAQLDTTSLVYTALTNLTGAGTDTLKLEFCRADGSCDDFSYVITAKRRGTVHIAPPMNVAPESVNTYCLENVTFPGERRCSQFTDCPDNYDGEGQQLFSFIHYSIPDTCVLYYANRFPGTDTVCVVMCDEYVVCDTFKIPFVIQGDTLTAADLPIFDDFSYPGPYPTPQYWLDKQVYVNRTFADSLPAIGMATFDGIDRKGKPYDFFSGVADRLTSKAIDLSNFSPEDEFVLKFYVAIKGYGKAPSLKDSLVVEFRDNTGKWVAIDGYPGFFNEPFVGDTVPPFEFKNYLLDQQRFFHKAFQFRFKAYSSPGGAVDMWHVDYVWFGPDGLFGDDTFQDVAYTMPPNSILKRYTAMPWWHFREDIPGNLGTVLRAQLFNHSKEIQNVDDNRIDLEETVTGTSLSPNFGFFQGADANLPIKENAFRENDLSQPPIQVFDKVVQFAQSIPDGDERNLRVSYSLNFPAQGAQFFDNDRVSLDVPLKNYFAYDDGSAERQISFKSPSGGEQLAVRYTTNVDDTLRAVQILFPHLNGDVQTQVFNLRVYLPPLTKDSEPVYEQELLTPFYPDNLFDTLQGFTTYRLEDILGNPSPLFIPKGDFYLTFMQVTSGVQYGIPIGYDANNTCDSCLFVKMNITTDWTPLPADLTQAPTFRPVFGSTAPATTSSGVAEWRPASEVMDIFPNPTSGTLFVRLKSGNFDQYRAVLFNELGQVLSEMELSEKLHLPDLDNGVYFLQIQHKKTNERFNHKLFILK